eukprot:TRINITY_DN28162_c0_g1_i1.p2 TRINITY_DN28162_c0_g1~~TRINITY_DN28162_c0_g1_i1.p2  ORF type:complete len:114 (-),score=10.86 TRINITY_DN28162_c0_g1_i1:147-488(-)
MACSVLRLDAATFGHSVTDEGQGSVTVLGGHARQGIGGQAAGATHMRAWLRCVLHFALESTPPHHTRQQAHVGCQLACACHWVMSTWQRTHGYRGTIRFPASPPARVAVIGAA